MTTRAAHPVSAPPRATSAWRAGVVGALALVLAVPAGAQAPETAPVPVSPPVAASASAPVVAAAPAASAPAGTVVTTSTTVTTTTSAGPAAVPAPAADPEPLPAWTLATLPDDPVAFHGLVNMDNAGLGSQAMLYPMAGLGIIGLLAGIAAHAAIIGGVRSSQESKLQLAADKVVAPYHDALARFHARDLEQRALAQTPSSAVAHLSDAKDAPADEAFVLAVPEFAMTADSAALVLDATIVVRPSAASDKGVQQVVRVISAPRLEEDVHGAWAADDGAALKATAAALMAESLDVALRQSRHPAAASLAFRTLRYRFGDKERMERAQLLEETCDYLVMRTLRGALLVTPHKADALLPVGCAPAPVVPERKAAALPATAPDAPTAASAAAIAASAVAS
jgi:hypothetical protein